MTTISDLNIGDTAKVLSFKSGELAYRQKLIALGLTPGTPFVVNRLAPLGDPVEISLRGFALSLRKKEASLVLVEKVGV